MNIITQCGISDATNFESLWALPALPLTDRFGTFQSTDVWSFDQELLISVPTGHVQLRNQLEPDFLYDSDTYSFRTGAAKSSNRGVRFFEKYLARMIQGSHFKSAVDIGGNDLSVGRGLLACSSKVSVVDPVCSPFDGQQIQGIQVIGRFIESVDLSRDIETPDLVVCRHTLEHITNPRSLIRQLFRECDPNCLYVFEVPCLANLVESLRFDAVFHQHLHYFDIESFNRLLWECGGECIDYTHNTNGSMGGSLVIAFRRSIIRQVCPFIDVSSRINWLRSAIVRYQALAGIIGDQFVNLPSPVYGYGASQMLATLAYQLKTDFRQLVCVLDDDPARDGMTYQNVPVQVGFTGRIKPEKNSSYVITSLENVRSIYQKIVPLCPRRVLMPIVS
jgi:hypothetical protein